MPKLEYPTETVKHNKLKCLLRVGTSDPLIWRENVVQETVSKHLTIAPGQKWIDCGACIGTFALYLLSKGAAVYAVEPWKEHVELYRENMKLNGFQSTVFEGAVVNEALQPTMTLSIAPARGKYRNFSGNSLFDRWKTKHQEIPVDVISFDKLVSKATHVLGKTGDWNLKLDIEGAEVDILKSADLGMFKQVYFEYHYQTEGSIEAAPKIIKRLEQAGFTVKLSKPVKPPTWWNDTTFLCWAKRESA